MPRLRVLVSCTNLGRAAAEVEGGRTEAALRRFVVIGYRKPGAAPAASFAWDFFADGQGTVPGEQQRRGILELTDATAGINSGEAGNHASLSTLFTLWVQGGPRRG